MASTPAKSGASTDRHDALSEVLAESWWAVGLRGILGIAFGLICLLVPAAAMISSPTEILSATPTFPPSTQRSPITAEPAMPPMVL